MSIRGSLREVALADVLQLLALGRKSGCLAVTHRGNFGSIFLDSGMITYASIVNRRDRLGDMLVKTGLLTAAALEAAVEHQGRGGGVRLGDLLVHRGLISQEALDRLIRVQIEEAVYVLFTWGEGTFRFEPGLRPDEQDVLVSIRPEALLLEGARRVDEWSVIEKKIPALDVVFALDTDKLSALPPTLTPVQQALLTLIDGMRDVSALVEASGMVEFEVGKALYGLLSAGYLQRVGESLQATSVAVDVRVAECWNLGLAYLRVGMLEEARTALETALASGEDGDGRVQLALGCIALRQGEVGAAEELLGRARRAMRSRVPPPVWFHHAALAAVDRGDYARGIGTLEEGIAAHPSAGVLYANLAAFLLMVGRVPDAGAMVERGLAVAPGLVQLHRTREVVSRRTGADAGGAPDAKEASRLA